ncbi:MAG: MBL fold metallo-hydrolase [Bacteriovoracaceae bacterium]
MSKIIDAVSIVMTCGDEIFAIQRQNYLKAFPGYWAPPGGKVEKDDENFFLDHPITKGLEPRLFGAAVREGKEELGIDLRDEITSGRIDRVDFIGLAVTPDFNPYRFATHFFRFHFNTKVPFVVDTNEAREAHWLTCKELVRCYDEGKILAVPPVIKMILSLGQNPDLRKIDDLNFDYDKSKFVPYIENLKGIVQIMPVSHTLPPATRTNAFLIGGVLLDPSPISDEEYDRFKNTLGKFSFNKILITHHHPDHHERSTRLAQEFNVPMLLSQDTHDRLSKKIPGYFDKVKTIIVKEGDVVTKWLNHDVVVYEVPGHDKGQIALASRDLSWFIAGDLFQGVGTVVIGDDEGDMAEYFKTLEKVINLSPRVIFPSHGIGLGGVNLLQTTLDHRRTRENQVLTMYKEGLTVDQMLEKIYEGVDKALWPYARKNIDKHLVKLKNESKI